MNNEPPDLTLHKANKQQETLLELQKNVEIMRENLPAIIEYQRIMAQIKRARFTALTQEGFTQEQALYLCQGNDIQ